MAPVILSTCTNPEGVSETVPVDLPVAVGAEAPDCSLGERAGVLVTGDERGGCGRQLADLHGLVDQRLISLLAELATSLAPQA